MTRAPGRAENRRFERIPYLQVQIAPVAHLPCNRLGQIVKIQDRLAYARTRNVAENAAHQRFARERDGWLRANVGKRSEAGAEARREDQSRVGQLRVLEQHVRKRQTLALAVLDIQAAIGVGDVVVRISRERRGQALHHARGHGGRA